MVLSAIVFSTVFMSNTRSIKVNEEKEKCVFFIYLLSRNLAKCCTTNKLLKIIHNKQGHV